MTKVKQFLATYNVRVRAGDDQETALQATINQHYQFRPEWARADLYARLAEQWGQYFGTGRRIFLTRTLRSWEAWYIRTPTKEESDES